MLLFFDYCDSTLTDSTDEMSLRLDRALNACVRFIFDLKKGDHVTPHYRALAWLRAHERRRFHLLRYVHILIHRKTPTYLAEKFSFIDTPSTRSELTLRTPIHRTSVFNKSFQVSGCREWNSLPFEVRRLESAAAFRGALIDMVMHH